MATKKAEVVEEAEVAETAPVVETSSVDDNDDNEFNELLDREFDDDEDLGPAKEMADEATEEAPVEELAEEAEGGPDGDKAAAEPKVEEQAAETSAPEVAQEAPTGEQPSQGDSLTPEQLEAAYNTRRQQAEQVLQQHYALSDEQVEEFDTDPKTALPKLAARLHLEVMQAATLNIARMLPDLVRNVQTVQTDATNRESMFFQRWPELQQHKDTVIRFGQTYRANNPQASVEDFIEEVGSMVMVAKRINPQQPQQPAPAPQPKPFQSAVGGRAPAPRRETNEFSILDEIIEGET